MIYLVYFIAIFEGIFVFSASVPMLEYCIVLSYPMGPSYSQAVLNMTFTVFTLAVGEIFNLFITKPNGKEIVLYSSAGLILISGLFVLCMGEDKVITEIDVSYTSSVYIAPNESFDQV